MDPNAAFSAAMVASGRKATTLMRIALNRTNGTTLTLNLATRQTVTPDGAGWASAIDDPGVISAPGAFMTNDVGLCAASPRCDARAIVYAGSTLASFFTGGYVWVGSSVTMWMWPHAATAWVEAFQSFTGTIQSFEFESGSVTLMLRQRVDWNCPMVDRFVTREEFLNATDEAVGAGVGTIYGKILSSPARLPQFATPYPLAGALERIRGGTRLAKGILVEPGRGDAKARVLYASHVCATFDSQLAGSSLYMETEGGKVASLRTTDSFNTAELGAGTDLADGESYAYVTVLPTCCPLGTVNGPENVGALFNPNNEQSFCRVYGEDSDPYHSEFNIGFDSVTELGNMVGSLLHVIYRCTALSGVGLKVFKRSDPGVTITSTTSVGGTSSGWQSLVLDIFAVNPAGWDTGDVCFQTYRRDGYTATGYLDICAMAIEHCYTPEQTKIETRRTVEVAKKPSPTPRVHWHGGHPRVTQPSPYAPLPLLPATQEVTGKFFANLAGQMDDESGTYTGVASAVIERPCDIARHALATYGKQALGQFDDSFSYARDALKTWSGQDMVLGFSLSDSTDVMTALSWIARSSASWFLLSPYSDKWRCVVWGGPDAAPSRTIPLGRFVGLPVVSVVPDSSLTTSIRIPYGYDERDNSFRHEVSIAPDKSCAGYDYHQQNDQSLKITAGVNDKIDVLMRTTTAVCSYTLGSNQITRSSGSFLDDGFFSSAHDGVVSDRYGIPVGARIMSVSDSTIVMDVTATASSVTDTTTGAKARVSMAKTLTLAAGDHTFTTLMDTLCDQLRTVMGVKMSAAFGGIITPRCCWVDFTDPATQAIDLTLAANGRLDNLHTMEEVATQVQAKLLAVSAGWTCEYSRTTKKFTISRPAASGTFTLLFSTGVHEDNASAALGFLPTDQGASLVAGRYSVTSHYAVEERIFAVGADAVTLPFSEFSLCWRTGPNGMLAHNPPYTAHSVLGFVPYDDATSSSWSVSGVVPKGTLQTMLRTSVNRYISKTSTGSARRDLTVDGRAIYDTATALELRNRLALLASQPRVVVSGLVDGAIGVERGDIVAFDLDDLCPYPDPDDNGSWASKGLVVTETVQHLGPDNCGTEIVAVSVFSGTGVGWDWTWGTLWG